MIVLIAFLSPIAYAITNIIDAHVSNRIFKRVTTLIFYNSLTNCLIIPFLFLFDTISVPPFQTFLWLVLTAVIEISYLGPYYLAVRKVDTSITVALFSLGRIFIPVLAYFMVGEKLGLIQYLGFFIIIAFNLILIIEKEARLKINSAFFLMLFVSLILTFQVVIYKRITMDLSWVSLLFWNTILSSLLSMVFLLPAKRRQDILRSASDFCRSSPLLLLNEFFAQAGNLTAVYAIAHMPVLIFEGIDSTQAIWVLAFGLIFNCFGKKYCFEKIDFFNIAKKLVCFFFIIFGVTLTLR